MIELATIRNTHIDQDINRIQYRAKGNNLDVMKTLSGCPVAEIRRVIYAQRAYGSGNRQRQGVPVRRRCFMWSIVGTRSRDKWWKVKRSFLSSAA